MPMKGWFSFMERRARRFQRVAHRGGSHLAPENTLAAFRNALTLGVDAVEMDVQMTRDGHAIVFHDTTIERLTEGEGNILDLDFAYLRSLDVAAHFPGGWPRKEQIPTLHEVLELARRRVQAYIEIKASERDGVYGQYPQIVETVVSEIRATNMADDVLVISFDWSVLPRIKALESAITTGMLVADDVWDPHAEGALETLLMQARKLGVDWVNMDYTLCTEQIVTLLHSHNLKLGLWTVNTIEALRHFAHMGVDSLTTDRPDLFADMEG
jgi:glycerophosphoryl diester phosphodiesterase